MANLSLLKELSRTKPPHPPVVKAKAMTEAGLSKLTKAKLLSYAEDHGYDISDELSKAEIVTAILAAGG